MKSIKKLFLLLVVAVAVPVASCVNEPMSSEDGYGAGEVAALQEQAVSVNASVEHVASVEVGFGKYLNELGAQAGLLQAKAQMAALAATSEAMEAHSSYLGTGVSRLEGTLATLSLQKELAQAVGAFEGSLAALDSKESKAAYDKHIKNQIEILCDGAQNWIGKSFAAYFTALRAEAKLTYMSESLDRALNDQKTSVDGLISDVEAGIRSEEDADELYSLSEDIDGNSNDSKELVSVITEIATELETECEGAIKSVLTTGKYDSSSLKTMTKSVSAVVKATTVTLNELINRVAACEAQIETILQRLSALEASLDVIQSVTFVPEYVTESAVALYSLESEKIDDPASPYNGYCKREPAENIELNYLIRPAAVADALATAFSAGTATLKVFGYYANGIQMMSVSSANAIDFAIQNVTVTNSAQGLIKVSVTHNLDDAFYFKQKGAKCAFSITSGKTDLTSKFVDLVPKDNSKTIYVEGIRLSDQKVTFDDGDTYNLSATVSPSEVTNPTVSWTSSNTEVVTIDNNGKMTAVGAGNAIITATTNGTDEWGFPMSATCDITVQEAIKLAGPAYVEMGKTAEIQLDYPSDLIVDKKTWWIEEKTLGPKGTVENGIVTPTSYYYNEDIKSYDVLTVKCQVNETVVSHELMVVAVQPTAVKILSLADNQNTTFVKLGGSLSLAAEIYPNTVESGLFRIQYSVDPLDKDIAAINFESGGVSAKKPGTAKMYVNIVPKEGYNYFSPGTTKISRVVSVDVQPYWVTGISFANSSYEMAPNTTMKVTPILTSDGGDGVPPSFGDLKWSSSNTNIATVDEKTGEITSKANGTCTITVTTNNEYSVPEGQSQLSKSFSLTVKTPSVSINPGDFFYTDGTWSSTKQAGKTVVGIVVSATNITASDAVLSAAKPECYNGLVVGLFEQSDYFGEFSYMYLYDYLVTKNANTSSTETNGYALTKAYEAYRTDNPSNNYVEMFDKTTGVLASYSQLYDVTRPRPSSVSTWYVPSYKEMQLMHDNLTKINDSLYSAGGTQISGTYWSSTLYNWKEWNGGNYNDLYRRPFDMSTNTFTGTQSSDDHKVRVVFAF